MAENIFTMVVYESGAGVEIVDGLVFPETGVYFAYNPSQDMDITQLTISGYTGFIKTVVNPMDEKYLPDSVATKDYVDNLLGVIENGSY